jgi:hypothetical protein
MRVLTNLLFKVTLSSMVLTAPAMINGNNKYAEDGLLSGRGPALPYYTSAIVEKYINHPVLVAIRAYPSNSGKPTAPAVAEPAYNLTNTAAASAGAKAAELRIVINQAGSIYNQMDLENAGLNEKAFEYAWRGYHNLVKKGIIRKKGILSICDFSQSSCSKRMYVIDVQHRRLLYRTYVAHGQKSGEEYASSFSNEPESFKSSLGFYITDRLYYGRNGLSLRLNGVDSGYNDMALKRNIVLHGSAYVGDKYMQDFGTLGTSLGCPALPAVISGRIIRAVRGGSCLFIYHPTQQYLDSSTIINS